MRSIGRLLAGLAFAATIALLAASPAPARQPPDAGLAHASSAEQEKFDGLLAEAIGRLQQHLGAPWPQEALPMKVVLLAKQPKGEPELQAITYAENSEGHTDSGTAVSCEIDVMPFGRKLSLERARAMVAHEAFHCFQAQLTGLKSFDALDKSAPWLIEGSAAWADATIGSEWSGPGFADPAVRRYWKGYLSQPGVPLIERSYDAIGFYAQLAEQVADPWQAIGEMLKAGGSGAAFDEALKLANPTFSDDLPSGLARAPGLGPAWDFKGPQIPDVAPSIPTLKVVDGSKVAVKAAPYANALARAKLAAQVVKVEVAPGGTAFGRLRGADGDEQLPLADGAFSTDLGGARCPSGTKAAGRELPPLRSPVHLAVAGVKSGATVLLEGRSLKDYCNHAPKLKSHLVFSGLVDGHTSVVGACGLDHGTFFHADFGFRMGDFYDLGLSVEDFAGPQGYEVLGPGTRSRTVTLSDTDKPFDVFSTSYFEGTAGTIVIDGNLTSGMVEADMPAGENGLVEHVSGTWQCQMPK